MKSNEIQIPASVCKVLNFDKKSWTFLINTYTTASILPPDLQIPEYLLWLFTGERLTPVVELLRCRCHASWSASTGSVLWGQGLGTEDANSPLTKIMGSFLEYIVEGSINLKVWWSGFSWPGLEYFSSQSPEETSIGVLPQSFFYPLWLPFPLRSF